MNSPSSITIVIVNYRTPDLVLACLESLEQEIARVPGLHVVLVDNASGDGSSERLRLALDERGWRGWITLIMSRRNGGFSAGCNIGIRARTSDFYFLLNPDTTIHAGAILKVLEFMRAHPRAGIAGSSLERPDGSPERTARRCPSPLSELDSGARYGPVTRLLGSRTVPMHHADMSQPVQCDWVSGAAMCVRREVFEEIGLLDERYFLYYEEIDLCERARMARRNWQVWAVPESRVIHHEGASTGRAQGVRPLCWYDSRRRFFLKRYGVLGLICADLFWTLGRSVYSVRRVFASTDGGEIMTEFTGLLLGDAKAILTGEARRITRGA